MKKTKIKGIQKLEKTDLQRTKAGACGFVDGPSCTSSFILIDISENEALTTASHYAVVIY